MDPLRHYCTQLYGRPYIYRDTIVFETILIFFPLSATLSFPNRFISLSLSLSLNTVPEEKKLSVPVLSIASSD
jgi:hypothetical protein